MNTTRRDFGKIALASVPALSALLPSRLSAAPNSKFGGVQIGTASGRRTKFDRAAAHRACDHFYRSIFTDLTFVQFRDRHSNKAFGPK